MSTQVEINGEIFLPLKDAAKQVSYSKDYVAKLAREQKIVATQIGRQWFVDTISLKNFAEISLLELSVRKQQLSRQRKSEQVVKQEVKEVKKLIKSKGKTIRLQAQLVAVFVLCFGLLAGAGIYTTTTFFPSQTSSLARLGAVAPSKNILKNESVTETILNPSNQENNFEIAEPQATTLFTSVSQYPVFADEAETKALSLENSEGIFLLARRGDMSNKEEVENLFSDEVTVRFTEQNNGVISYERSEGEVAEFPFVSVPSTNKVEEQGFIEVQQ